MKDKNRGQYFCHDCMEEPVLTYNNGDGRVCGKCQSHNIVDTDEVRDFIKSREVAKLGLALSLVESVRHEVFDEEIQQPIRRCFGLLDYSYGQATNKYEDGFQEGEMDLEYLLPEQWLYDSIWDYK